MCRKEKRYGSYMRIVLLLVGLLLCASMTVAVYAESLQSAISETQEATAAVETVEQAAQTAETVTEEIEPVLEEEPVELTEPVQEEVFVESTELAITEPTVDSAELEAAQEDILALQNSVKRLEKAQAEYAQKMVWVYVALGLGAVGILMGVVATLLVCMNRSDEPPVNVAELATREAAEQLDKQNRRLRQELQMQDRKLDEQISQLKNQQEKMEAELERIQRTAQSSVIQKNVPASAAAPVAVQPQKPVNVARQVGYLKLEYQSIAPAASFLENVSQVSEYVLYSDDTVAFINAHPDAMNQLSGWITSGLLYMFNPVLDGVEVDADNCQQYSDYYLTQATVRRAKIRQINGGNYVLLEKGAVEMKKA